MSEMEIIDRTLRLSGWPGADEVIAKRWIDVAPEFEDAHFLKGFAYPGGKFRFRPDWRKLGALGDRMPEWPDQMDTIERADAEHPFRLVAAPARGFLNTSFTETPSSRKREGRPTAMLHPDDLAALGLADGAACRLGNARGAVTLHAKRFDGVRRGVVIVESIWPNAAFPEGVGINALIGDDPAPPAGGAVFHDTAIWVRPA
jgi:anaerobic selenocysteine-containing dehydrogenase